MYLAPTKFLDRFFWIGVNVEMRGFLLKLLDPLPRGLYASLVAGENYSALFATHHHVPKAAWSKPSHRISLCIVITNKYSPNLISAPNILGLYEPGGNR